MGKDFYKPDPKDAAIIALTTKSMDLSDKISAMNKNTSRTTGGGSGGGTASCKEIVPGIRDLPLWRIVKNSESVERDRKIGNGTQNTRNRNHMTSCMSHTRLTTIKSGISEMTSSRHVEK